MFWSIIITCVAGLSLILGIISKAVFILIGTNASFLFGLHPDAYLRFASTLILFAIAIAIIVKFKKE